MGNGQYCYPLTVSDRFSRYVLACEGFEAIDGGTREQYSSSCSGSTGRRM